MNGNINKQSSQERNERSDLTMTYTGIGGLNLWQNSRSRSS